MCPGFLFGVHFTEHARYASTLLSCTNKDMLQMVITVLPIIELFNVMNFAMQKIDLVRLPTSCSNCTNKSVDEYWVYRAFQLCGSIMILRRRWWGWIGNYPLQMSLHLGDVLCSMLTYTYTRSTCKFCQCCSVCFSCFQPLPIRYTQWNLLH